MRSFIGLSFAIVALAVAAVSGSGRRRDFRSFGSGAADGSLKPRDYPLLIFRPEA